MVSSDDLDRYTFNIVPERDIVPMFDDKAQNYQSKTPFSPVMQGGC